ncbi:Uncharacterized protein R05D3.5 [Toxocara canis]|uniref:Major sperm protein n=1 Tax=Toxocara canis TaxID=6265 RepID=A0A0B2VNQ2_TOXCA|nr:Uncharacterized protein R05D3.5 [Toxocara canis]
MSDFCRATSAKSSTLWQKWRCRMIMFGETKERPFELKLDPDRIVFRGDNLNEHPTSIRINIKNTTDSRQVYKVKCTSADIFRVKQPIGFIKPGETISVRITFVSKTIPPSGKHFFVFFHMKTNEEKNPRQLWTSKTQPDGMRKLLCYFEKDDGRPACEMQYQRIPLSNERTNLSAEMVAESVKKQANDSRSSATSKERSIQPTSVKNIESPENVKLAENAEENKNERAQPRIAGSGGQTALKKSM